MKEKKIVEKGKKSEKELSWKEETQKSRSRAHYVIKGL